MNISKVLASALAGSAIVGACVTGAGEAVAAPAPCGQLDMASLSLTARDITKMPSAKYTVTNCGTEPLAATVTVTEYQDVLATACPAPLPAPQPIAVAAGKKATVNVQTRRGPCGWRNSFKDEIVPSVNAFQERWYTFTLTDNATGAVLSASEIVSVFDLIPRTGTQ